jgi:hypothetical protein
MKYFLTILIILTTVSCQQANNHSDNKAPDSATSAISQAPSPAPSTKVDTLCYESRFSKEVFSLMLVITNDKDVTGTLNYVFHEKDSAYGTLKGRKTGDYIDADYTFTIEGSEQIEVVEFKIDGNRIMRKIGELTESGGKLVLKDSDNSTFGEEFKQIDCAKAERQNTN